MEYLITGIVSTLVTIAIAYIIFNKQSQNKSARIETLELENKKLEREKYQSELDGLEIKNKIQEKHLEELKKTRAEERQKGYEDGLSERNHNHSVEISRLKAEHHENLSHERSQAAQEAKEYAKREYEQQTKLFSVQIKPYVKIKSDIGYITDEHISEVGYQYQLLVNGIPTFQPHIIIEKSESYAKIDKEKIDKLVELASTAAKVAAKTYLSGATSAMLEIGDIVIDQVKI